jgi:hypothetical protein
MVDLTQLQLVIGEEGGERRHEIRAMHACW